LKKKRSIHDLARELNLSATTISFVLNGKAEEKRISGDVVKKVNAHVKRTGYQPNQVAKSLRTGKTKIIGMLVEDIADPFFSSIARVVEENLYKLGYKIFHSSTDNKTERAKELLRIFRERQVDGYIIAPSPGIEEDIEWLVKEGKPVVLFDRYFPKIKTKNIVIDNEGGAFKAVMHLVANGYSKIAFVTLDSDQVQMKDRLKGYNKAIVSKKLQKQVLQIGYSEYKNDPLSVSVRVREYLNKNNMLDAVLFATNYLAVSGLQAIKELGLSIPEDLAVVGFDDNTHFSLFSPSVTAVAQPVGDISSLTVKELIDALGAEEKQEKIKPGTIVLDTELIVRESSVRSEKNKISLVNKKKSRVN
jgi:LacI family transcriptional regulator